ncbi:hypothetical protein EV175_006434 [Coemansia sp. RSA 1933]|nr:hypothetical protein EV175_006434 [Coemansia sp. RSA 1933]
MNLVNKAYGGATSNNEITLGTTENITIPSFHDQVVDWLAANPSPGKFHLDNDVIQIEIGSNDILNNVMNLLNGTVTLANLATKVATSIATDIQSLIDAGYKNIALWNIPAIEKTPLATELQASALVTPVVQTMNNELVLQVNNVIDASIQKTQNVRIFDLYSFMITCLDTQILSALGITDTADACYVADADGSIEICNNPDEHFFYDYIHPASRIHYTWGVVAAVLTRSPSTTLTTSEILSLVSTFNIGSSDRTDNIVVDGVTPSEAAAIPNGSSSHCSCSSTTK